MLFELESMTEHTVTKRGSDRNGDIYFEGVFAPVNNPMVSERIVRAFMVPQSVKDSKGNLMQSEATLDYYRGFIDAPQTFPKQEFQKVSVDLPPFNLKKKGTDEWIKNKETGEVKVYINLSLWCLLVQDATDKTKMVFLKPPKEDAINIVENRGKFIPRASTADVDDVK